MMLVKRFISDSEAFRQEERDKITKKRIAMAKYIQECYKRVVVETHKYF